MTSRKARKVVGDRYKRKVMMNDVSLILNVTRRVFLANAVERLHNLWCPALLASVLYKW